MPYIEFWVPSNRHRANGMPQHMDGTNEIVGAGLTNRNFAARRKRENTKWVAKFAAAAMADSDWVVPDGPVRVSLEWHEVNQMRDVDNIAGGVKYVLDALGTPARWSEKVHHYTRNQYGAGLIRDDSQKWVRETSSTHVVDKDNPGVKVRVETID